jgi:hypothetical protein
MEITNITGPNTKSKKCSFQKLSILTDPFRFTSGHIAGKREMGKKTVRLKFALDNVS